MITRYILLSLAIGSFSLNANHFKEKREKKIERDTNRKKLRGAQLAGQALKLKRYKGDKFPAHLLADDALQEHFENE